MIVVMVLVAAAIFGGADQYLGSFPSLTWGASVSLLSAPWLLIAFLAGWTQPTARRGVTLGLGATLAALLGYGLMTWSPIEGAHLTWTAAAGFIFSERLAFLGGAITGPLFGWFGHCWRARRAWAGASLAVAAFLLEPVAHSLVHDPIARPTVGKVELAVGALMAIYVSVTALGRRRSPG